MKKLLLSDITKTIYLTNAKPIKNHPKLFEAVGEKQDFTKNVCKKQKSLCSRKISVKRSYR